MPDADPIETAWHIHDSLCDWTGKVDVKAAFALSIESAVLIAIADIATGKHRLGDINGCPRLMFWVGVSAVIAGALFAARAVCPAIRKGEVEKTWRENFIFFGHLHYWAKEKKRSELECALRTMELLPMLSRQLAVMGDIAWRKHRWLQVSFIAAVFGCALVGLAAILN